MNHFSYPYRVLFIATLSTLFLAGCGGTSQQKKDKDFYTSGSRDADQRADQRMSQEQQLTGGTNNGHEKVTDTQAVIASGKKPLFERLGGEAGIKSIVDDFVTRALADPRVNWQRIGVKRGGFSIHRDQSMEWDASPENVAKLKAHLAEFFALATGGPAKYTGKELKPAHENMHITNPEFDATIGDLKATLDKLQIANQEQKELLATVESTREIIVEER